MVVPSGDALFTRRDLWAQVHRSIFFVFFFVLVSVVVPQKKWKKESRVGWLHGFVSRPFLERRKKSAKIRNSINVGRLEMVEWSG